MGLFSAIGNIFKTDKYVSTTAKVANLALTAIVHPIGFIKDTQKAYDKTMGESTAQLVVGGASNTALVLVPFSAGVRTAVGKSVATVFTKSPLLATGSTLIGAGALITSPTIRNLAVDTVSSFPEKAIGLGEKVGEVVEDVKSPSDITEPEWYALARSLGLGAGIAILLGGGIYLGYRYYKGKLEKVKTEEPEAPDKEKVMDTGSANIPDTPKSQDTGIPTIAPERELTSISSKKRKRRVIEKKPTQIRINNAIAINNVQRNSANRITKNYLKSELLYN